MRRSFFLLVWMIFFSAGLVSASALLQSDPCTVPADQVIEGNLYVLCQRLVVDGRVTGDVLGAALTMDLNGRVDGSLYTLAGRLNLRGVVGGDAHVAGPILHIRPEARLSSPGADVYAFALSTQIGAPITGNVNAAGYELYVGAPVAGHVDFAGSSLTLDAPVTGAVAASVGSSTDSTSQLRSVTQWIEPDLALGVPGLRVTTRSAIGGGLVYTSPEPGLINGPVAGGVTYVRVAPRTELDPNADFGDSVSRYFEAVLRDFIATLLVGAVLVLAVPRAVKAPGATAARRPLTSFSVGLITFVLSFPAFLLASLFGILVVVVISLLGFSDFTITAAFVVGLLIIASAALFYFTAILISRVVVAVALARPLARPITRRLQGAAGGRVETLIALTLGGLMLALLSALPVIGLLITALITFIGLGAVLLGLRRDSRAVRAAALDDEPAPPPAPAPPPLLPRGPGTDNLPEGFEWWE